MSRISTLIRPLWGVLVELARIVRELFAIPIQIALAAAEIVGAAVLAAWRLAVAVAVRIYRLMRDAVWWGRIHIRPAHGVIAVAAAAALALGASQFVDYRGISVGTGTYSGVANVAPAPEVDRATAGSAHAWAMIPIALLALIALAATVRGRWRAARLLFGLGVAAVAISLLVDAPKGLDEGGASIAYESVEAELLAGFWAQLVAGGVLALCGPLLVAYLRPTTGALASRGGSGRRGRRRAASRPIRSSPVAESPIQGMR